MVATVHVIGAGAMGAEIAAWAAIQGKQVTLGDVKLAPLGQAVKAAAQTCRDKHLSSGETRDAREMLEHREPRHARSWIVGRDESPRSCVVVR